MRLGEKGLACWLRAADEMPHVEKALVEMPGSSYSGRFRRRGWQARRPVRTVDGGGGHIRNRHHPGRYAEYDLLVDMAKMVHCLTFMCFF
jgi:hypothetical protein